MPARPRDARRRSRVRLHTASAVQTAPRRGLLFCTCERRPAARWRIVCGDGPLTPAQAVSVGVRLADALAALHEKKCLHGAVKPSVRPSLRVIGVRLQDVAGRGSRDRQPHRAVQLHAVDLEEQLRTCSGVSVGASRSMSDRTPTGQDGTTYTEFYVAGVPQ